MPHPVVANCRSNGHIDHLAEDDKQHVKLFNCNFDFTYAEHFHTARFGPGAFIQLLDVLFHESIGRHIEIIRHGKIFSMCTTACCLGHVLILSTAVKPALLLLQQGTTTISLSSV